jgi:hypothetical protein
MISLLEAVFVCSVIAGGAISDGADKWSVQPGLLKEGPQKMVIPETARIQRNAEHTYRWEETAQYSYGVATTFYLFDSVNNQLSHTQVFPVSNEEKEGHVSMDLYTVSAKSSCIKL